VEIVVMSTFIPGEKEYVLALAKGELETAKQHLCIAISAANEMHSPTVLSGLAQRLGSLLLKQGDLLTARALYELSENLDSTSLLARLDYAKFLWNEIKDRQEALAKANSVIEIATQNPFPESEDDFSSEDYIKGAKRLIAEIEKK
jgi:hypothetical protein